MMLFWCSAGAVATAFVVAVTDARTGKMPNVMTLGSLFCALFTHWWWRGGIGLASAFIGLFVTAFVPLVFFVATRGRAIGGGDVKALAALGAWLGPTRGLEAEILSFLFLAVFALARELWQGRGLALAKRSLALVVPSWRRSLSRREMIELRFGPALAAGTLVVGAAVWSSVV